MRLAATTIAATTKQMITKYYKFTVFFKVPGSHCSSTVVEAPSKEEAASKVNGIWASGKAVVTNVFSGEM